MARWLVLAYGVAAYLGFLAVFLVMVDFLANAGFVRGIDQGAGAPLATALAIDVGLIALFGVSHSVLARAPVKERVKGLLSPAAERSTYVLVANLALGLIAWQWRPLPDLVWHVSSPPARLAIWAVSGLGVALIVASTFLTDHFDLFGLRQVWLYARGREYTPVPFREWGLYRWIRHPMMLGVLIWIWATPSMTIGHLFFAGGMTLYILVGVTLEERSLARDLGAPYDAYRRRVGAILPRIF
jgi:methanethiol S-methyltransferase